MSTAAATKPHRIEVLKLGRHVDTNGVEVEFTEAMLQAIADGYDPAAHEAPYVVGHPKTDDPAYGWAQRFVLAGGVLFAESDEVDPDLAELVRKKHYKKVSMALYGPRAPANPKPGIWYPRHVGFLGAQPPAIKGLKSVQFAEADAGVHEFAEVSTYTLSSLVRLFRGLRDWILAEHGQETADRVIPSWELDSATNDLAMARAEDINRSEGVSPAFAEGSPSAGAGADEMPQSIPPEVQQQLDAANQRAQAAEQELATRRAADQAAVAQQREQAAVAFADRLVSESRLPAEMRDQVVAIHQLLGAPNAEGSVLSFGEGDKATTAVHVLEQLLGNAPAQVEFGEYAKRDRVDPGDLDDVDAQVQFSEGVALDQTRMGLHEAVLARQRKAKAQGKHLTYAEALQLVNRG
jgi:hypothetical protein